MLRCYDLDNVDGNHILIERPSVATMRIVIGLHCASTPYKPWYDNEDVEQVLINWPEVVKERYLEKNYIQVITSSVEPHKHSWLDRIVCSEKYWLYMLDKVTGITKRTSEDIVNT